MTEKYFKYLIKQSLPLFGIILIGGSFFVTGLINLDNLPAYVFLLSAGVPFLFELSRYHKKSAYFYSSLPIEQKNLWIIGTNYLWQKTKNGNKFKRSC